MTEMAQIYLIDDDDGIVSMLKLIIESNRCGDVCGVASNGEDALEDLEFTQPDIVIVDLLMPRMDGITFIQKAKERFPEIGYIMLSQVSSKEMIAHAYDNGIEFYIQKPINSVEVVNVVTRVKTYIKMSRTYRKIRSMVNADLMVEQSQKPQPIADSPTCNQKAAAILQRLGIGGDSACKDICEIVSYIIAHQEQQLNVNELCRLFSDSPKALEQRIRRAITAGMVNLAHMGLEDYHNDTFSEYAGTLYRFEQIHREMDFIRGKTEIHGRISLRGFLYTMADLCQSVQLV